MVKTREELCNIFWHTRDEIKIIFKEWRHLEEYKGYEILRTVESEGEVIYIEYKRTGLK